MSHFDRSEFLYATRTTLATVSSYPGDSLVHAVNREFDRPDHSDGAIYVRELLRVQEEPVSSSGYIHAFGRCNYDVFVPRGAGMEDAETLAKEIADAFRGQQSLTATGFAIVISRSERGDLRPSSVPDWSFIPVSFLWRVSTPST